MLVKWESKKYVESSYVSMEDSSDQVIFCNAIVYHSTNVNSTSCIKMIGIATCKSLKSSSSAEKRVVFY